MAFSVNYALYKIIEYKLETDFYYASLKCCLITLWIPSAQVLYFSVTIFSLKTSELQFSILLIFATAKEGSLDFLECLGRMKGWDRVLW